MKLLKTILLTTAAAAAFTSTAAFADPSSMAASEDHIVLAFNPHGSYNLISSVPADTMTVGLSVCNRNAMCSNGPNVGASPSNQSGDRGNYMITLRDNAHGQQVPR